MLCWVVLFFCCIFLSPPNFDDLRFGEMVDIDRKTRSPLDCVLWKA